MKIYEVVIDDPAEDDLRNISNYIAQTLNQPIYAKRIYKSIRTQISTLKKCPERCQIIDIEPYRSRKVRLMTVENYNIFYLLHTDKKVHVTRIMHGKRDWMKLL